MSDFAIEVTGMVREFNGDFRALDGVSLRVPRGQVFGLLGPNGSGKTTMVRILSTILKPTSGTAVVGGFDVVRESQQVRSIIGLAGQNATVDEYLSGLENLRMVGRLNHMERDDAVRKAHELLEQFGLTDAALRPVRTYSGGMRRRLDLAAALVASPPILFLDEPTTGLDPQSRLDLWAIIEGLVESGTTVLLTTQYLEEADRLAEQLVVLDHGKVIAEGTASELKHDLGQTVLALSFASIEAAASAEALVAPLSPQAPIVEGSTIEITVDDGARVAAEALRQLDAAGVELTGLMLREPSLDDVFLHLTGHRAEDAAEPVAADTKRKGRHS